MRKNYKSSHIGARMISKGTGYKNQAGPSHKVVPNRVCTPERWWLSMSI